MINGNTEPIQLVQFDKLPTNFLGLLQSNSDMRFQVHWIENEYGEKKASCTTTTSARMTLKGKLHPRS